MTTEIPPTPTPASEPPAETAPGAVPDGAAIAAAAGGAAVLAAEDPEARRRRRRRAAVLLLLAALLGVFVLFTGWYLINRKPVTELPLPGVPADQLPHYQYSVYGVVAPTGVAVSPDGSRIYVTQTEQGAKVLIFDHNGNPVSTVTPPATTGSEHVPVYVALNPTNGDLYVSDRPTGSIYVYSADGAFRRVFDPGSALKGWQPLGLAFDSKGDLFVTDVAGPSVVQQFDPSGAFVQTIGQDSNLSFPNGVAVDAQGYVYVTDSNNGRLLVFDGTGKQVALVRRGAAEGDLGLPRGTAIDGDGRVYVVDTTAQGVQVYKTLEAGQRSPSFVGRFGSQGTADGAFQYPNGVAVDGRARVYVTDWRNNRVQVWTY